ERHAEVREERFRVLIGPRRRDDVDVHAADLVDLVVDDLGEDHLLPEPERVVPSAVESLPRHALEVAHARQRDVDEPIEKLVHPRTTERHLRADRHALAQLEVRDRLLCARDDRLLPADRLQIGRREVEHLGVLPPLAHTHVDHDLLEARHLPRVRVPALLHQRRDHRLLERHLDPRRDLARALRTPLRDGRALRRARALLRLSLRRGGGLVGLRLRRWLRRILGHDPYPLSIGSPHRLQMRTLRPSASTLVPIRTGRSQRPHTSSTFERWSAPSRSMMPPWRSFCVGRWCFLTMLTFSTRTRPSPGMTRSTLPRLPRSFPAMTATVSPRRTRPEDTIR